MNEHSSGSNTKRIVSLITPCYNEAEMVGAFLERVGAVTAGLPQYDFELLFVDDGSTDETFRRLCDASDTDSRIRIIRLSRNFGHQRAITAGLDFCSGNYVIVIDADLQDPPELIPRMLERLEEGVDIVHMVRERRDVDSLVKRVSAKVFYYLMRQWVLPRLPENAPDFKGFNRRVLDALRRYRERVRFMRGIMASLGFRQESIPYVREARHAGRTKYNWKRIGAFGRDAIVSYSPIPIRLSLLAGLLTWACTLLFVLYWLLAALSGCGPAQPLTALLLVVTGVLSGLILVTLGVIGEYLGVIVREVKHRPLYIIESTRNMESDGASTRHEEP